MTTPAAPDPFARTWAVVPLRGLESAKTRLAPELDAEERLALVTEMAERTLRSCRDAVRVAGTILITLDPEAAALAESFGARTIVQRLPGLNAAIREARSLAVRSGATAVVVLPIDLPRITAGAVDALIVEAETALTAGRVVALVPDRHGTGTNALVIAPPEVIDPAFGPSSRALHRAAARDAGVPFVEVGGPLTYDVDTASDLLAAEGARAGADG